MADISTCLPLTPSSILSAHSKISGQIHRTPLLPSKTLSSLASTPLLPLGETEAPTLELWFKCENMQKIGAFKARGGFYAVERVVEEFGVEAVRRRGVVTHSSGNHAQALALAASIHSIPAYIIMPSITTPSKIAGTRLYTPHVIFSGSTAQDREKTLREVQEKTGAIFVPPYNHPDIILGQGTAAMEMSEQFDAAKRGFDDGAGVGTRPEADAREEGSTFAHHFDAVLAPCGGGGLLSGTATWFSDKPTHVFGAEPSYQGANDAQRGLAANPPQRIEVVKSLTIADGLRSYVGEIPWSVITGGNEYKAKFVQAVYSVTEEQIKDAMRLVLERLKVFIEPSAAVGLAVVLYDLEWRRWVLEKQKEEAGVGGQKRKWDVGVIFSGGNTTIDAILGIFGDDGKGREGGSGEDKVLREEGKVGMDGKSEVENVAG